MQRSLLLRRAAIAVAVVAAAVLLLLVGLGVMLDAGLLRKPLLQVIAARAARPITVSGPMQVHLFSLHPRVVADQVSVGNPSWMPAGTLASIGRVSLVLELPGWHRPLGIARLDLRGVTLTLVRNDAGLANWQWRDPRIAHAAGLVLVHGLTAVDVHATLHDDKHHLQFTGTAAAFEPAAPAGTGDGAAGGRPLKLQIIGELNGRAVLANIDGDPLAGVAPATPYGFTFDEHSTGAEISGSGTLPRPFDFNAIDARFAAHGRNLRDLYYLTGVSLLNTGPYQLTGKVTHRGAQTDFTDLVVSSGESDVAGRVAVDSAGARPQLHLDFESRVLRVADLGARAAGKEPPSPTGTRLLLSAVALDPAALRRDEVSVRFHAQRLEVGPIPIRDITAALTIDHGVLTLGSLTGQVFDGALSLHGSVDATTDEPADRVDLDIAQLNLAQYLPKGRTQPLVEGLLRVRVAAKGHGRSLHEFASSANGTLSAAIPHGLIRAALAELPGFDLAALGLFAQHAPDAALRCGVAAFDAHDGTLTAQTLVVDTDPALITGSGTIQLQSEAIELALRGQAKRPELRLKSPLLIRGTLAEPKAGMDKGKAVGQTAGALALGAVLTPLASILAFIDPGLAQDADCAALLGKAAQRGGPRPPSASAVKKT